MLDSNLQLFEFSISALVSYIESLPDDELGQLSKIEGLGYRLGQTIVEKSTIHTQLKNEINAIKFICKTFWTILFNKEIDKLSTDRKGTYKKYCKTIIFSNSWARFRCSDLRQLRFFLL